MKQLFKKRNEPYIYSHYYLRIQNWWSCKMSALSTGLSRSKLILLLVLFVTLAAGYLIYNIYKTVSKQGPSIKNTAVISKVSTIKKKVIE